MRLAHWIVSTTALALANNRCVNTLPITIEPLGGVHQPLRNNAPEPLRKRASATPTRGYSRRWKAADFFSLFSTGSLVFSFLYLLFV